MNRLKVEIWGGLFLVFSFLFLMPLGVKAAGEELPAVGDPFWDVMAQINRPDDSTCTAKATAILETNNIPGGAQRATATCAGIAGIVTDMQSDLNREGVSTNLFSETNWHHVDNLYFDQSNGRIEFTNEVDFMSRSFMLLLSNMVTRLDFSQNETTFDADIVGGMRDAGSVVTMRNVSDFSSPEILVDGAGDAGGVVSGMTYNQNANTIVFNAAHFTTFKAVEGGDSSDAPRITKISTTKLVSKNGKERIRVSIEGKRFDKKMEVKLGSVEAYSVHWKNKNKVTAYFSVKEVLKKSGKTSYFKVKNVDGLGDKYKKQLNILTVGE
jgi:hypothetical protein